MTMTMTMTMTNPASKSIFPTGSTVPFPYETPYPQQTALMNTLLQCLQYKDQEDQEWRQQQQHKNKKHKKPRAAVMLLESPTGTGKSLSLACSAMAWLKYCEERDLNACASATSTSAEDKDNANDTTDANAQEDWWNAWVPPEQKQKEEEQQLTQATAREARTALQEELAFWRNKLYRPSSSTDTAAETTPGSNDDEKVQQRRENSVRSAVITAKLAEQASGGSAKGRKAARAASKQFQDDYCVADYNSERRNSVADDFCDDDDNDDDDDPEDRRLGSSKKASTRSASVLLDGHCLDGSHRAGGKQSNNTPMHTTISHVFPGSGVRKIVYAARTHSQLSQFCGELKRTAWGDNIRVVALGSRKLLCGNSTLKKKHSTEASLTEACLDLKQGKSSGTITLTGKRKGTGGSAVGCPLLQSKEAVSTLGMHLLTTPSDIEDAAKLGTASQTCAYYASRKALAAAEVVVLPYSMLLSPSTRKAIGLSLQECLVLVDEAHNLPEALRQLHSSALSLPVIEAAQKQLQRYFAAYRHRLRGENIMNIGNLIKVLKAFATYLKNHNHPNKKSSTKDSSNPQEKENQSQQARQTPTTPKRSLQSTNEFLLGIGLGHIKLINLQRYLENSGLSQKLLGFTRSKTDEGDDVPSTGLSKHVSAMAIVQTFLEKLNLKGQEGKIVTEWPTSGDSSIGLQHPTLRYALLQPASCFDNVLEEAHAVALVGGTLSPFGHVAAELLAGRELQKTSGSSTGGEDEKSLLQLSIEADLYFNQQARSHENCRSSVSFVSSRFAAFTCDHVIDKSRIFLKCLSFGPTGQKFDFRHQPRMTSAICEDLGQAILQLCQAVPNGLVVFLPSYSYEAHLVRQWQQSGLFDKLNQRKKVFREPKSAQQLDMTLRVYASHAAEPGGALLLSVIGGKMSEGINLSNSMARGVVVVGLPYPDSSDPILKEKMTNLERCCIGGISGQAYYQNLCMRAVNQSCGRSIRHAHDYAAIILCDYRYASQSNIWEALPKWLRAAPSSPRDTSKGFGAMTIDLESFFVGMKGR